MPTLTEIVRSNPTLEEQDLELLFNKKLDVQSQLWFLQVGVILGLLGPIIITSIGLGVKPSTLTIDYYLSLLTIALISLFLELRSSSRKANTPSSRHEKILKDYLQARQIIRDRAKPKPGSG